MHPTMPRMPAFDPSALAMELHHETDAEVAATAATRSASESRIRDRSASDGPYAPRAASMTCRPSLLRAMLTSALAGTPARKRLLEFDARRAQARVHRRKLDPERLADFGCGHLLELS